jgi:hypothetical protein
VIWSGAGGWSMDLRGRLSGMHSDLSVREEVP